MRKPAGEQPVLAGAALLKKMLLLSPHLFPLLLTILLLMRPECGLGFLAPR